jgi:hypothetical protein
MFDIGKGYVLPLGMDDLPLQFEVPLFSQPSDDKAWRNTTINPAAQPWDTIMLDESSAYTDEAGAEKVILTLGNALSGPTEPTSGTKMRWM